MIHFSTFFFLDLHYDRSREIFSLWVIWEKFCFFTFYFQVFIESCLILKFIVKYYNNTQGKEPSNETSLGGNLWPFHISHTLTLRQHKMKYRPIWLLLSSQIVIFLKCLFFISPVNISFKLRSSDFLVTEFLMTHRTMVGRLANDDV